MTRRCRWLGIAGVLAGGLIGIGCGCGATTPAPPVVARPPAAPRSESAPATRPRLKLDPESVHLRPGDPGWQMIVESPDGRHDLSASAVWSVEPEGIIAIEPGGYLRPLAPGKATLRVRSEEAEGQASVEVDPSERGWSFAEDVLPLLTRAGCNTGGCHGKADGQNGFHLSLFGYDHEGDYRALTRDLGQRRVSPLAPEHSLVLGKATGRVPHGGGPRIAANSPAYRTLLAWIAAGAPEWQGPTPGALVDVRVEPPDARLDEPGPRQLRVLARYADGHDRDVTRLASFRVNDDSAASIDSQGRAVLLRRAETDLIVRYRSRVVAARLATLINPDLSFDFAALPRRNLIDEELFRRLESLRVPPSPRAGDAVFFRRVALDLTGEQPEPEEVRRFLADTDPDKRPRLVDRLLARPEFVEFWGLKLGDLLQITSTRLGNGASRYKTWIYDQIRHNTPWDQVVRALLTAIGNPADIEKGGPVNYALDSPDPRVQAEQTAQRFLALRMRCAQCHDHPFDVWTQDDYYGLAAFFARVQSSAGMNGRMVVKLNPAGQVEHPRTKRPAPPRLLDGQAVALDKEADPRTALAAWMTAPDNPFFARAVANWTWAQFFGKGLADPADDLSRANPPVHPELLDALARHFIAHKFDLRDLIRTIAVSEAYGLSTATVPGNEHDTRLFSHQLPRPLTAHQMADALAQATDVPNRFPNQAAREKRLAIQEWDPSRPVQVLDTFGRCARTIGCAPVANPALSLRQALLVLGGDVVEAKVSSLNGYLANLLELNPEPDEIVENLYMRTLCRPPISEELAHWSAELQPREGRRAAAEDLFWALLNSREFAFNH